MTIGIDISSLQSAHRKRGIGFTLLNFINHISADDRKKHRFIFYALEKTDSPIELLKLDGMDYDVRFLKTKDKGQTTDAGVPTGRLRRLLRSMVRQFRELLERYMGSSEIRDLSGIDVFFQPDQSRSLPKGRMKKVLMVYDIIPYVLEWDYLWTYKTARLHGFSRKAAWRCHVRRWLYLKKLKVNARRANLLLAISQHTKDDFVRFVGVNPKKIIVTHLGVADGKSKEDSAIKYRRYEETSWGYSPRDYKIDSDVPFLLFVGGADQRRRLDHLVTAFNHLRAQGNNIGLILAGDTLQGARNIPTPQIQNALASSSYLHEIVFMGFVTDEVAEALFRRAFAFVYPSIYEGFGLPILQAMRHGTPVITYNNSSINEVAGQAAIYTRDYETIVEAVENLYNNSETRDKYSKAGRKQASKFSWSKTANHIVSVIE